MYIIRIIEKRVLTVLLTIALLSSGVVYSQAAKLGQAKLWQSGLEVRLDPIMRKQWLMSKFYYYEMTGTAVIHMSIVSSVVVARQWQALHTKKERALSALSCQKLHAGIVLRACCT